MSFPTDRGSRINLNSLCGTGPPDLYNTRHTFATHALASGEDPGWVATMLGHTMLTMLMTRYYRDVPNLVRRDGLRLTQQLERRRTPSAKRPPPPKATSPQ